MMSDGLVIFLIVFVSALLVSALIGVGVGIDYYISCRQAEMFNQLNGTTWTCSDFFWVGDQINSRTITIRP
jgi:hypothetical protein